MKLLDYLQVNNNVIITKGGRWVLEDVDPKVLIVNGISNTYYYGDQIGSTDNPDVITPVNIPVLFKYIVGDGDCISETTLSVGYNNRVVTINNIDPGLLYTKYYDFQLYHNPIPYYEFLFKLELQGASLTRTTIINKKFLFWNEFNNNIKNTNGATVLLSNETVSIPLTTGSVSTVINCYLVATYKGNNLPKDIPSSFDYTIYAKEPYETPYTLGVTTSIPFINPIYRWYFNNNLVSTAATYTNNQHANIKVIIQSQDVGLCTYNLTINK